MAAAQSSGGAETGSTAALCGAIAGACNVVAGHPLDTCKVVLQASPGSHFRGTLHVASSLGFKGLYRGLLAPLLGGSLETSVNYTVYHACRRLLPPDLGAPAAACVAGGAAGVALSVVLSPLELVKCRVQAGVDASVTDAVRRVWLQGGPSGFTRGFGATLARELPGNALFFASYEGACAVLVPLRLTPADAPVISPQPCNAPPGGQALIIAASPPRCVAASPAWPTGWRCCPSTWPRRACKWLPLASRRGTGASSPSCATRRPPTG